MAVSVRYQLIRTSSSTYNRRWQIFLLWLRQQTRDATFRIKSRRRRLTESLVLWRWNGNSLAPSKASDEWMNEVRVADPISNSINQILSFLIMWRIFIGKDDYYKSMDTYKWHALNGQIENDYRGTFDLDRRRDWQTARYKTDINWQRQTHTERETHTKMNTTKANTDTQDLD